MKMKFLIYGFCFLEWMPHPLSRKPRDEELIWSDPSLEDIEEHEAYSHFNYFMHQDETKFHFTKCVVMIYKILNL